ncbi:MAG TPA: asparagine synthase C-terminal domain-containing protein, partial [Puia sp.]|nr:asparagine synthase C-terminal domain-containing protein [Puia sp.]
GSCLSGGIDSSSIVTLIHHQDLSNAEFATITSCFEEKEFDEQEYSDEVSRQTGFRSIKVFPQLGDLLEKKHLQKLIYHQEQPLSGASHFSEFSVFGSARENGIIVLLDGQGSDEYFYGYDEFFTKYVSSYITSCKWLKAWRLLRFKARLLQTSIFYQWKQFFIASYWHSIISSIKRIIGKKEYPCLRSEWEDLANKNKIRITAKDLRDLSIQEIKQLSIPFQLHSADRNSMSFSIEVREPFMDYRMIEYVVGLPDEYKINKGYSKYILRESMPELPAKVKNRNHKMGFVAPDAMWMLKNKIEIRKELEDAIANTSFFTKDLLDRFDRFCEGKLGYEPIYFRAITMNHFCRIYKMQLS